MASYLLLLVSLLLQGQLPSSSLGSWGLGLYLTTLLMFFDVGHTLSEQISSPSDLMSRACHSPIISRHLSHLLVMLKKDTGWNMEPPALTLGCDPSVNCLYGVHRI